MRPSLPLLLKLCAAAAAGAAALLAARRLRRAAAVAALRRSVRSAAASLPGAGAGAGTAATVLVAGFPATARAPSSTPRAAPSPPSRALSSSAPWRRPRPPPPPPPPRRGGAAVGEGGGGGGGGGGEEEEEEEEAAAVELVEAALPEPSRTTAGECGGGGRGVGRRVRGWWLSGAEGRARSARWRCESSRTSPQPCAAESVMKFLSAFDCRTDPQESPKNKEASRRAPTRGRLPSEHRLRLLHRELHAERRVEPPPPAVVKNDFDTDFTILAIVRQCLEFVKLHRSGSTARQKPSAPARTVSHVTLEDPKE
uniref:Uncharacterized protein n=1 Tax=Ananas comosus var. bracteatus TaxID=296719 RepID=A0A6V7QI43_ANACO|nr:unnamed protein product [Ananas comosus var. bracteatus]